MIEVVERVGYFAVDEQHLVELRPLYDQWRHALDELQEDARVIRNSLYDRTDRLARYCRVLVGSEHCSAHAELAQLFFDHLWKKRRRKLFTTDEVVHYHARLTDLMTRLGGEDGLVKRADPLDLRVTDDHVRAVYRAFLDVFTTAADRGLGYLSVVRYDGEEEWLAERAREREESARRHAQVWGDTIQPIEEVQAELAAVKRRMRERYGPSPDDEEV